MALAVDSNRTTYTNPQDIPLQLRPGHAYDPHHDGPLMYPEHPRTTTGAPTTLQQLSRLSAAEIQHLLESPDGDGALRTEAFALQANVLRLAETIVDERSLPSEKRTTYGKRVLEELALRQTQLAKEPNLRGDENEPTRRALAFWFVATGQSTISPNSISDTVEVAGKMTHFLLDTVEPQQLRNLAISLYVGPKGDFLETWRGEEGQQQVRNTLEQGQSTLNTLVKP